MGNPKSISPEPGKRKERRHLRLLGRLFLRLFRWFLGATVLVVMITCVVAVIAWHQLTGVVTMVANQLIAPYRIEFGKVDASKRGLVLVEDLALYPPAEWGEVDGRPWVSVEQIDITYDLRELRLERRFRTAVLLNPVIRIDDHSLDLFGEGEASGSSANEPGATPPDLRFLGKLADRVDVVGGLLEIDTSHAPPIQTKWDLEIPAVDFGGRDWINEKPVVLQLTEVAVGVDGRLGTIEGLEVNGRLRADFGGIEITEVSLKSPKLTLSPDHLAGSEEEAETGEDPVTTGEPEGAPVPKQDPGQAGFEILVEALQVSGAEISIEGFDGREGRLSIPDTAFATAIDWRDLKIQGGEVSAGEPVTLTLQDFAVDGRLEPGSGAAPPTARIERLEVVFDPETLLSERRLESVEFHAPVLELSPDSLALFLGGGQSEAGGDSTAAEVAVAEVTEQEAKGWSVGRLEITEGRLLAEGWNWEDRELPSLETRWEVELEDLSDRLFSGETTPGESSTTQQLRLDKVLVGTESSRPEKALLSLESLELRLDVVELMTNRRLEALTIDAPVIQWEDDRLPSWVAAFFTEGGGVKGHEGTGEVGMTAEAGTDPEESGQEERVDLPPFVVEQLEVNDGNLRFDSNLLGARVPVVESRFQVRTEGLPPGVEEGSLHPYRLFLSQMKIEARSERSDGEPTAETAAEVFESEREVASARQLTVDFTAEGLQRDRKVDRIELRGADFFLGSGLQQLLQAEDGEEDESKEPGPEGTKSDNVPAVDESTQGDRAEAGEGASAPGVESEWTLGEFLVTESRVHIESLIPQVEGLEFAVETRMEEVPLGQAGLLAQDHPQKVELAGIEIRDPYDSFITVAFLPTIFVEFSFAGLVEQRIDKIDLMNPAIHIGQGLFWWVDYQRNYRAQNEGGGFEGTSVEVDPGEDVAEAEAQARESEADESGGGWSVGQINAHFGKLVIAPTGQPIGIVPFPFDASTNLDEGEISLSLQIPKEQQYVYEFPDLKLALFGLSGNVEFNVPIEQEDNNLVQTFSLDRAVWKQYEVEDLYLTVTYDTDGIYGRFGGVAYGGYAEGQFNIYLNDVGVWDAWLAGTDLDMGPITEVIAPESFLMAGKVNAKLVSEGRKLEFGETHGEILALSPGHFDFTKANEFIENLPEGWSHWKRSATQLSLETLKRFNYETGKGDLYFINRDGWLRLNLEGETGSRNLEVHAHDWRSEPEEATDSGNGEGEQDEEATSAVAIGTEEEKDRG